MRILCDVDNVVGDLTTAVLDVYNEDSEDNLTVDKITKYNIENFVKPQYKETFYHYFLDKRTWNRMKLVPNVQKYMAKLFNDGHEIYFCTKTEMKNAPKKESYLQRIFPYMDIRKHLIVCYDKSMVIGDALIDDCLSNFSTTQPLKICLAYPWNKNVIDPSIHRCNDWEEIYSVIKTAAAAKSLY
jgi:5'(3')-deoxyribonucleotidase